MKSRLLITKAFCILLLASCAPAPQKSYLPLEIQAIQQQDFETTRKIAFSSVISVLQDLSYLINSADIDTGFITAKGNTEESMNIWTGVAYQKHSRVTAYIEEINQGNIRIRLNFVKTRLKSSAYGQDSSSDEAVLDRNIYIEAFNKIENAIFIRS